jgi:hypothetical protein
VTEIGSLSSSLEAYHMDLGAYPPDYVIDRASTSDMEGARALVVYLGRRFRRGGNSYGPYIRVRAMRTGGSPGEGVYLDPWGSPYRYAENESENLLRREQGLATVGMKPGSFDLLSAGADGELGGTIAPATGYVPASGADADKEKDNVTNWGE